MVPSKLKDIHDLREDPSSLRVGRSGPPGETERGWRGGRPSRPLSRDEGKGSNRCSLDLAFTGSSDPLPKLSRNVGGADCVEKCGLLLRRQESPRNVTADLEWSFLRPER